MVLLALPLLTREDFPGGSTVKQTAFDPRVSPADLPNLGIQLGSPALQVDSLPAECHQQRLAPTSLHPVT